MFVIHFLVTFRIGDTIDCEINGGPAHVTYEAEDTLVIEPGEVDLRKNKKVVEIIDDRLSTALIIEIEMFRDRRMLRQ
jgi:hypothetical protein